MKLAAVGLTIGASAAVASDRIAPVQPMTGSALGYEFDWGPMIAGLLACLAVRFYVSKTEPEHRWTVDAPVTLLTLFFTFAFIQSLRPIPLVALGYGTGLGAFGVGIIRVALAFVQRNLGPLGDDSDDVPKPPSA
ncbi:hypothetical protein [Sphingomonas abietis]|uniref:Uncharacterized protein n=1 Tax=Sphingomonas abietis TaxID=3012344 RepID=A0ABY7NPX4_9SPHN|nr:hypothetical protein [Sphingomonas abietis]WBO21989.1 hypothetical protein PBT88_17790 [Sphingomonas abietis]